MLQRPPVPASASTRPGRGLTTLLQFYTPDHPEVVTAQRLVAELQTRLAGEAPLGAADGPPERPASPAELAQRKKLLDLKADLLVVEKQLESSREEEAQLKKTIASLQAKVDVLPSRESELVELTRDYGTLQAAYSSLLTKREDSLMAANLERRQIGEQFRILDPASMPEKPFNQMQRLGDHVLGRDGRTRARPAAGRGSGAPRLELPQRRRSDGGALAAGAGSDPGDEFCRASVNASVWRQRWMDAAGVSVLLAAVAVVVIWRLRS